MYTLRREQFIAQPISRVFEFFARPENLARITPPWLRFVLLTPPPVAMEKGALIDYAIRLWGIRIRWTSVIAQYQAPTRFLDKQIRGPYRMWEHQHEFQEKEGGTLIIDEVRYALPLGWLGTLVHALYVKHALRRIFDFRQTITSLLLEG